MKDGYDKTFVPAMWLTRRLVWAVWVLLLVSVGILAEGGITVLSTVIFIATLAASLAVPMIEIERSQPADDAKWREYEATDPAQTARTAAQSRQE